jgi:hypothetical protein
VPAARIEQTLPRRIDFTRLILQSYWGVSVEALLSRSRELGVMSDPTHRRARIKLNELRKHGVVRTDDVVNVPGERPQLLLRAAAACGDPIAALADELAWSTAKVEGLLGRSSDRPRLTLLPADE